jgi:DNA mismatch repair protein MutS
MSKTKKITPMMQQYRRVRGELPSDVLLLFRLGDFYEMFFEDAQEGSKILNVALTKRGTTPMCGIPYHAANGYIARILKAGRKVAICDQVEEAIPGQLVKREVTQIISPGTHFDERILVAERNNFLASVYPLGKFFGIAIVDLTTGDFQTTEVEGEAALMSELERIRPAEMLLPEAATSLRDLIVERFPIINGYDDWVFEPETSVFTVREHFKVASLDGFGLKNRDAAIGAAGGILHYLSRQLRRDVAHLTRLSFYQSADYLALDMTSLRNLEILEPLSRDAPRSASLFGAMNRTATPMGARRLREWLTQPLSEASAIGGRQEVVQAWLDCGRALDRFRERLGEVRDLERTLGRLSVGTGTARDLGTLRQALEQIPFIRGVLAELTLRDDRSNETSDLALQEDGAGESTDAAAQRPKLLRELEEQLGEFPDLVDLFRRALVDEPPLTVREGGMIADGYDAELDELKSASRDGKNWIARMQQEEIEKTGISSLKVRYNSVFGYFIEVTRANVDKVPPNYVRKQTIANGERYITPELKEIENKILGAEERSSKLEYELFLRVREAVIARLPEIQDLARALSQLDVLGSFAETARLFGYCRPDVREDGLLEISEGRHPILDQSMTEEPFVPNDTRLDSTEKQIGIITGPNMAGKSTYIRQVALLALLAHTGSFIPATQARVDLIDRIFTRIGASDDLSRGQSTFMVEMSETANILNNATSKSLIILDEIGRGTSTFDGLSLAWSIVEHLHNQTGAKTLFATHYHELTELAGRLDRVRNFNVAVREWNEEIIFLRKIVEGGTDKSYGIQVARLAGVPKSVLERAKEILGNLEEAELTPEGKPRATRRHKAEREKLKELPPTSQLDLFG